MTRKEASKLWKRVEAEGDVVGLCAFHDYLYDNCLPLCVTDKLMDTIWMVQRRGWPMLPCPVITWEERLFLKIWLKGVI